MACAVTLLAAILCTMLFGPTPVLVVLGLGAVYAALVVVSMGIGEVGAGVGRIRFGFGQRPETPNSASIAGERAVRDAIADKRVAREPWAGVDAKRRREPVFNEPAGTVIKSRF